MSQLSAQSIKGLCVGARRPMISPFSDTKNIVNGKSWGLSAASYDVRIAHDLTLGPHPGYMVKDILDHLLNGNSYEALVALKTRLDNTQPCKALANTIESFIIPDNVKGDVCDKSSFARVFVSAFNTLFDPGFEGNATLELVNHSDKAVEIKAGDPICQFSFIWLDMPTDRPYAGKYQGQSGGPQPAIYELGSLFPPCDE